MNISKERIIFFSVILLVMFLLLYFFIKNIVFKRDYLDVITKNTKENFIDPYLILSIIKTESKFNENAISRKNAYGLMQILFSTADEVNNQILLEENLNENDLLNPNVNIALGTKYISNLINYYNGNYHLALCAYNAGCGNVDKWINDGIIDSSFTIYQADCIPFEETKNYIRKVLKSYSIYKKIY